MMTNGTSIASATTPTTARTTQRRAPRRLRSRPDDAVTRGAPGVAGAPGAVPPGAPAAGGRTRGSVAMSAALLALARGLRPDERERHEDDDDGQHGRDGGAVAHLRLGEEVLVREVRR